MVIFKYNEIFMSEIVFINSIVIVIEVVKYHKKTNMHKHMPIVIYKAHNSDYPTIRQNYISYSSAKK